MRVDLGNGLFKETSHDVRYVPRISPRCQALAVRVARNPHLPSPGALRAIPKTLYVPHNSPRPPGHNRARRTQTPPPTPRLPSTARQSPKAPLACSEESVKFSLGLSSFNHVVPRWLSVGPASWGLRVNWLCSLLAIIVLWGFGVWCIADGSDGTVGANFDLAKSWTTQNFTWFYIGTQDVWCILLIYLCCSRYGDLRLGKDNERPRFGDFTWFALLFTCGVAAGLYYFAVAEPLYFYRQPASWKGYVGAYDYDVKKTSVDNDAMRAQQVKTTRSLFVAKGQALLAARMGLISHWGCSSLNRRLGKEHSEPSQTTDSGPDAGPHYKLQFLT